MPLYWQVPAPRSRRSAKPGQGRRLKQSTGIAQDGGHGPVPVLGYRVSSGTNRVPPGKAGIMKERDD